MKTKSAKEILEQTEQEQSELVISSLFSFEQLQLNKGAGWTLKLSLKTSLPETLREYKLRLSLNELPFEKEIESLKQRQISIQNEPQLFEGNQKQAIRDINDQIRTVENDIKNAREIYEEIEFHSIINSVTYKDRDTVVVLSIPADTVEALNKHRNDFVNYKVELIRD